MIRQRSDNKYYNPNHISKESFSIPININDFNNKLEVSSLSSLSSSSSIFSSSGDNSNKWIVKLQQFIRTNIIWLLIFIILLILYRTVILLSHNHTEDDMIVSHKFLCTSQDTVLCRSKELNIIKEEQIEKIVLSKSNISDFEASGVIQVDDKFYIVLDNSRTLVYIDMTLSTGDLIHPGLDNEPQARLDGQSDFEAITYDPISKHFFVSVEAAANPRTKAKHREFDLDGIPEMEQQLARKHGVVGPFFPLIYELNEHLKPIIQPVSTKPIHAQYLTPKLRSKRSGAEGLAFVRVPNKKEEFLFVLLQGNYGHDVRATQHKPGHGRIRVYGRNLGQHYDLYKELQNKHDKKNQHHLLKYQRKHFKNNHLLHHSKREWLYLYDLNIPITAHFRSYGDVTVNEDSTRIAIVSQLDSAIWIGKLSYQNHRWLINGKGHVFRFPTDKQGDIVYCNVEGLAFVNTLIPPQNRTKNTIQYGQTTSKEMS